MGKFTVTHEINCDVETFWKTFFDKGFNTRLYTEVLAFPEYRIVEEKDTDTQLLRKVAAQPKMDMPGPVQKLLGSNIRYTEEGTFDKKAQVYRWRTIASTMPDKIKQEGSVRVEALGAGRVRRVAELVIEAKVFGVGGLMESSGEKQLREGWDKSAAFMNQYVKAAGG